MFDIHCANLSTWPIIGSPAPAFASVAHFLTLFSRKEYYWKQLEKKNIKENSMAKKWFKLIQRSLPWILSWSIHSFFCTSCGCFIECARNHARSHLFIIKKLIIITAYIEHKRCRHLKYGLESVVIPNIFACYSFGTQFACWRTLFAHSLWFWPSNTDWCCC